MLNLLFNHHHSEAFIYKGCQTLNRSKCDYRYSFNGKEKDDEISGNDNSYDFGARFYNPRVARFLSTDPKEEIYPWQSSYVFAANNPICLIDLNGEGPEDPKASDDKFKKNILVVKTQDEYDMYTSNKKNKNWKVIFATSIEDAQVQIKDYLDEHNEEQADNIVLRSHGGMGWMSGENPGDDAIWAGQLNIGVPESIAVEDPAGPNLNNDRGLASSLKARDIENYKRYSGMSSGKMTVINSLNLIGTYAKNSVIFTGCMGAGGDVNVVKSISTLPGYKGKNVLGNSTLSAVTNFDTPIITSETDAGGYRLYIDGVLQQSEVNLILNTTGAPIGGYKRKKKQKAS
ncbi:MAG: RHS repeat-associated core domain-containing protein [Crocinitomicaceae bacterium]|nr:hypothetical protein [Crocinitomicaceae bacterium]